MRKGRMEIIQRKGYDNENEKLHAVLFLLQR
jgi:hypothetical protein